MPADNRRICGPESTIPYQTYLKTTEDSNSEKEDKLTDVNEYKLKPFFLRTGIISQAKGSAYIEIGNVKIIASVYGPREVLKKQDFNINGQLSCEVKYAPYSCPKGRRSPQTNSDETELSTIICDALKPAVCMQKFPKSRVDIFIMILDSGDCDIGNAITCGSLALVDAGIEMYDVVVSSSITNGNIFNTPKQQNPSSQNEHKKTDFITLALLPSLDQVSCFYHQGDISSNNLSKALKILKDQCYQLYPVVQKYLLKKTKKSSLMERLM